MGKGFGNSGRGKEVGKECGRVNTAQILCTLLCKWKMIPVQSVPGMR
jgi:hypothetical protein